MKPRSVVPLALALAALTACAHPGALPPGAAAPAVGARFQINALDDEPATYADIFQAELELLDEGRKRDLDRREAEGTWLARAWAQLDRDGDGYVVAAEFGNFLEAQRRAQPAVAFGLLSRSTAMTGYLTHQGVDGADRYRRVARDRFKGTPADYGQAFEAFTLPGTRGTKLAAWFVPAAVPTDRAVLLLHGLGSSKNWVYRTYGRWLQPHAHVLAVDFRASGESEGAASTFGVDELADAHLALAELQRRGGGRIGVMGMSLGGALALTLAAQAPAVRAVVSDSAHATIADALTSRARLDGAAYPERVGRAIALTASSTLGTDVEAIDPIRWIGRIAPRPVYLVHGEADLETLPANAQRLYDAAGEPRKLAIVPGAGHARSYDTIPEAYEAGALAFFAGAL